MVGFSEEHPSAVIQDAKFTAIHHSALSPGTAPGQCVELVPPGLVIGVPSPTSPQSTSAVPDGIGLAELAQAQQGESSGDSEELTPATIKPAPGVQLPAREHL